MDRDEQSAYLEWWANPHICLARIPIRATATASVGEWEAVPSPPLDQRARDNLRQLIDADPCFTLQRPGTHVDTSAVTVQVTDCDSDEHLRLTVIPEP